jgi:hypothetical protein
MIAIISDFIHIFGVFKRTNDRRKTAKNHNSCVSVGVFSG